MDKVAMSVRLLWADLDHLNDVRIEFADTGRGIDAENVEKTFDVGFTTQAGNPELGLAVCRTGVEQHGGTLGVASEPGKGTTFSVILPRVGEGAGTRSWW